MFKNITIFTLPQDWQPSLEAMEAAVQQNRFTPCGPTVKKSCGFSEPRMIDNGPLVELVAGQRILRFVIEVKKVPGAAIKKKAEEAAAQIEQETGRTPGRKEMKSLKEDAVQALLPHAFPKQQAVMVWFNFEHGWMITDASTSARNDDLLTALVRAFAGLTLAPLNTQQTPQSLMTHLLTAPSHEEWPEGFCVERSVVLRSYDADKSSVKFDRHHLQNDEIRNHISEGKLPAQLSMSWGGRIGFSLTDSGVLKKVSFLDGVLDETSQGENEDRFDADVALSTAELSRFVPALIDVLGGPLIKAPEARG